MGIYVYICFYNIKIAGNGGREILASSSMAQRLKLINIATYKLSDSLYKSQCVSVCGTVTVTVSVTEWKGDFFLKRVILNLLN